MTGPDISPDKDAAKINVIVSLDLPNIHAKRLIWQPVKDGGDVKMRLAPLDWQPSGAHHALEYLATRLEDLEIQLKSVLDRESASYERHDTRMSNLEVERDAAISGQVEMSKAAMDLLQERNRQINDEDWTSEHDDAHDDGELAKAAACYAWISAQSDALRSIFVNPPPTWPAEWDDSWWKPTTPRRDLIKAGALILAEIERRDRIAMKGGTRGLQDGCNTP